MLNTRIGIGTGSWYDFPKQVCNLGWRMINCKKMQALRNKNTMIMCIICLSSEIKLGEETKKAFLLINVVLFFSSTMRVFHLSNNIFWVVSHFLVILSTCMP